MQENQQVVFMSDCGEDVRRVQEYLHPNSEHVIDWFHITMRLTVLQQQTKSLQAEQEQTGAAISKKVESVKNLLWNGNVDEALERLANMHMDLDMIRKRSAPAEKLAMGVPGFETYISNNKESIPNFGERYRQGETISTAFMESTINLGSQQAIREATADVLDVARRPSALANADQSSEQRTGSDISAMVPTVPGSKPSCLTPGLLLLSSISISTNWTACASWPSSLWRKAFSGKFPNGCKITSTMTPSPAIWAWTTVKPRLMASG